MSFTKAMGALALGLAMATAAPVAPASAQTLRIAEGRAQAPLRVPLNRALVVESAVPFGELSVANPAIADIATLNERSVYVLGRAPGRTTLTLLGVDGRLISNIEVQVTPDIGEFKERLQELLPGEPVEVRTANDGLVLSGVVSSSRNLDRALEIAERYAPGAVLNLMVVGGTQQVMLKVRFAEMQRSVTKELGAQLGVTGTIGDAAVPSNVTLGSGATPSGSGAGTVQLNFGTNSLNLNILLQALESKGVVRTLAEPNLTALSGQDANFVAGGDYPVPVIGEEGNVSVSYRPFGVQLAFTPTVVHDDVINLQLRAAVSAIDTANGATINGFEVDAFTNREVTTTVSLRDGESFAIAGILQDDFRDSVSQVPFLGDLPILGALFRSASYTRAQSELVVIVTAHLVHPTRGEALALPTDRIRPPTENELFLYGRVNGGAPAVVATRSEAAQQEFQGNYGYVLD